MTLAPDINIYSDLLTYVLMDARLCQIWQNEEARLPRRLPTVRGPSAL